MDCPARTPSNPVPLNDPIGVSSPTQPALTSPTHTFEYSQSGGRAFCPSQVPDEPAESQHAEVNGIPNLFVVIQIIQKDTVEVEHVDTDGEEEHHAAPPSNTVAEDRQIPAALLDGRDEGVDADEPLLAQWFDCVLYIVQVLFNPFSLN
ncbi:hypothetical protein C0995_009190 [Termitomyces sp. Mi166|nr:hypothetical protein C0995_009190 [Termitomyces sp. Mi166\